MKTENPQILTFEGFDWLAVRTGLEPATPCVTGRYSNQLNYRTNFFDLFNVAVFLNRGTKVGV